MSLEPGVFWCSQVLDLSLLPLAFSLILTVASRLLHPYSTDDKTHRLMEKILHSEGHPERFTELHGEKKREEGDRGYQEEKRRNQRERESNLASNHIPVLSTAWNIQRGSQSYIEKRRWRKEIEVTKRRTWGVKRRDSDLASNQFPVFSTAQNTQRDSQS